MSNLKVEAIDFNLYYGEYQALKNIQFQAEENTITAFIGPSGCGKSTLLRSFNRMNDLIPGVRTEGETRVNGINVYDKSVAVDILRKQVGMVFQKPNPFPKSIFENVAYGLRVDGIRDKQLIEERVISSIKQAALWDEVKDKLKKSANALSGGQQQRVAIARALINEPAMIIADEPTGNLDKKSGAEVMALLHQLHEQGSTIVMVTHDQKLSKHTQRTIVLEDGLVSDIQVNPPYVPEAEEGN